MGTRKRKTRSAQHQRRPARAAEPLTEAQDKRYSLMRRNAVEQQHIADALKVSGIDVSRQTVGAVIRNKFVNDDVIDMFCTMTQSTRADAWPDVPPLEPGATRRTGTTG